MELLPELLISIGSAISAAIRVLITRRRRRARHQEGQASTSVVELRVTDGGESESVRLKLPPDEANRLLREARQVSGSETSSAETPG
jgi:hypothetical protein